MNLMDKNELFLLEEVVKKNFSAKYKDSVLGIVWSVLQPLCIMIIFTIIFSAIFKNSIDNFPVYFLSGRAIYEFFSNAVVGTMMAIKGNRSILKKTAAPKYIFILGGVISELINFIIALFILIGVMIVTHAPFHFETMFLSIIPIISLMIMMTGLGFLLSIACVYYSDVRHLWTIVNLILMYSSAIFYPMEIIPEPFRHYMLCNPLFWAIDQFRKLATQGVLPNLLNVLDLFLISVIILIIGLIIFKKYEKKVAIKF